MKTYLITGCAGFIGCNFAAKSHVDRGITNPETFVRTNVMGTVNLLQRAKESWYDSETKV